MLSSYSPKSLLDKIGKLFEKTPLTKNNGEESGVGSCVISNLGQAQKHCTTDSPRLWKRDEIV